MLVRFFDFILNCVGLAFESAGGLGFRDSVVSHDFQRAAGIVVVGTSFFLVVAFANSLPSAVCAILNNIEFEALNRDSRLADMATTFGL